MANDSIKFSALPTAPALGDTDIFAISGVDDTQTPVVYASYKVPMSTVARRVVAGTTFIDLKTSNKTVIDAINETISNLANDYDEESTYDVGDCVLHSGSLYQCNTAIDVAETWTPAHWTAVKAVDVGAGGGGSSWTDVTGTLTAGQTSITLSNVAITTTSTLEYFTDKFGVNPVDVTASTGSVTLTFEAQASNLGVKVRVS